MNLSKYIFINEVRSSSVLVFLKYYMFIFANSRFPLEMDRFIDSSANSSTIICSAMNFLLSMCRRHLCHLNIATDGIHLFTNNLNINFIFLTVANTNFDTEDSVILSYCVSTQWLVTTTCSMAHHMVPAKLHLARLRECYLRFEIHRTLCRRLSIGS